MDIHEYRTKLEQEAVKLNAEADTITQLLIDFPDLRLHTNRWGHKRYYSSSVNNQATDCEIYHSCGCCTDAPVICSPYLIHNGTKIYSDPATIFVGEGCVSRYGDWPDDNWEKELEKYNIAKVITEQVKEYFAENAPEDYDDDYDED